jgi:transposase InsO family protein
MEPRRLSRYARIREQTELDERRQSRKDRAVPLRTHRPAGVGNPAALIERLKRENPHRTGTALLRELAPTPAGTLSASTLYRFLRARGLTARQLLLDKAAAHKKYEAEHANQTWQSDMLFGPWVQRAGGGRMQVFLQATLDDASRLIPHAQFYPNQGLDSFLDCLRQAIAARGLPTRLYMDNAKIYRSPQLARIAASIGILIVHTPPYQPEGRGKIERFCRSVREQFLAALDPTALLSLEQLNERRWHWLDTVYHRREHSALQTTPLRRWQRDIEQIRQLPPATDMRRLFFHRVDRLVRRDSTFLLRNRFFEAPPPAPTPSNCSPRRPGRRSRRGSSSWPSIPARVCSPAKWARASPPPRACSPPRCPPISTT